MQRDRTSSDLIWPALRLWLKSAICLCALAMIVLGTASVASAAPEMPRDQLEFVKTPPPVPTPSVSDEPEITTTDSAQALTPAPGRSFACDQSTRVRLPLSEAMLDRSEPPQLRPPIA
ncbi:conserved hypothetical protein [Rhodopseudomonas palustris HaA2]|uniref:Uncharacterized protein n=2 Tax=Rhodopseudomonas palustris TaxID=1076 RepID=Q2J0N3_RHOP2|nr:conserved hypothetical protein [Rhodopseudomonas palustris HaA2]